MSLYGSAKVKILYADSEVHTACLTNCHEKDKLSLKVSLRIIKRYNKPYS